MRSLAGPALVLALLVSLLTVGLTEQASAAEPDEIAAAEGSLTPSQPVSTDTICSALAEAAAQNDLPTDFFARLIWQESRFDPAAVSEPARRAWRSSCLPPRTGAAFPIPLTRSKLSPNPQSSWFAHWKARCDRTLIPPARMQAARHSEHATASWGKAMRWSFEVLRLADFADLTK